MDLTYTIEEFDPGHFSRRKLYLEKVRKKFQDLGFFPLQVSESDILCYQLTFEDTRGPKYRGTSVTIETLEDVLENPDGQLMNTLKEVFKYDGTE